jgi:hypothetical protein
VEDFLFGSFQSVASALFRHTSEIELALFEWTQVGEGVVDQIGGEPHLCDSRREENEEEQREEEKLSLSRPSCCNQIFEGAAAAQALCFFFFLGKHFRDAPRRFPAL